MLRPILFAAISATVLACSSSSDTSTLEPARQQSTADVRVGQIRANDVWKNGVVLTGTVQIFPGAVVEIQPGASITCAEGGRIMVGGVLRVKAAGAHAKISCARWEGIQVAQGGQLDLEGIELENATHGIETTEGAGESTVTDSVIRNSLFPFTVGKSSKLTLTKVNAIAQKDVSDTAPSMSAVYGTLVASRLDYDAGPNEGVSIRTGGEATIEDSTIHGENAQDMVSVYGAKSLTLSYSSMTGAHCGMHIQGIDTFTIDHVTSEKNTYGITIYAAGAGPNVVKSSNLSGDAAWLDLQGDHGPITFENVFTSGGKEIVMNTDPATIGAKSDAPIADAKPR